MFQQIIRTTVLVPFIIVSQITHAQKAPIKFGDVSMDELTMTVYPKDSSAAAVILTDFGESFLTYNQEKGFQLNFERITRIKILTEAGLDQGNFSIPLYHNSTDKEKISGLKGLSHNLENGKVVTTKMKNESVFEEKYDENIDYVKVALPNVRMGSVIEITYKVLSDFIFNFQDWDFQNTIPIVWSEYRTTIPEYFNYDKVLQGYIPLSINENKQSNGSISITTKEREGTRVVQTSFETEKIDFIQYNSRMVSKDVPAFKLEPNITTYKDYISKINYELSFTKFPNSGIKNYMGSWEDINKTFIESEYCGAVVKGNGRLKDDALKIIAGKTSTEDKISAIHQYVRDNIQWNGSTRKYIDKPMRKVLDEKKGSSAELNLLMASMLEKLEIDVSPVLVSTRDHGFIREATPTSSQFNNVICLVRLENKELLLDATHKLLPTGLLPERCLNGKGLVISKSGHRWVNLVSTTKSRFSFATTLTMDEEGSFKGQFTIDRSGYYAEKDRTKYLSRDEKEYNKDWIGSNSWIVSESKFENAKDLSLNFKETHWVEVNEHATVAGNTIYINPFFINKIEENPYKLEKREYPVDFGSPFDNVIYTKITIPDNFIVDELPANKAFSLPNGGGRFLYSVAQTNNTITLSCSLQINKPLFVQDEYHALREFYTQVVAKESEQIVLKKKT